MAQFMYECEYCGVSVCLVCAKTCHAHDKPDTSGRVLPPDKPRPPFASPPLRRVGLTRELVFCGCARVTCQAMEMAVAGEAELNTFKCARAQRSAFTSLFVVWCTHARGTAHALTRALRQAEAGAHGLSRGHGDFGREGRETQ